MVVRRYAMFFAIALNAGLTAIRRCAYRGDVEFFGYSPLRLPREHKNISYIRNI